MTMRNIASLSTLLVALLFMPTDASAQSAEEQRVYRLLHDVHGNSEQSGRGARDDLDAVAREPQRYIPLLESYVTLAAFQGQGDDREAVRLSQGAASVLVRVCGPTGAQALERHFHTLRSERIAVESSYRALLQGLSAGSTRHEKSAARALQHELERLTAVEISMIRAYTAVRDRRLVPLLTSQVLRQDSLLAAEIEYLDVVAPSDHDVSSVLSQVYLTAPEHGMIKQRLAERALEHLASLPGAVAGVHAFACMEDSKTATLSPACTHSTSGGAIQLVHEREGSYLVTFKGIAGEGGNVQLGVRGSEARMCSVGGWYGKADLHVSVYCFDLDGKPRDGAFDLFYQRESTQHPASDVAYLWADGEAEDSYTPPAEYAFHGRGKESTVRHLEPGVYQVLLPGLDAKLAQARATAYGALPVRCKASNLEATQDGAVATVLCHDHKGKAVDSLFSFDFFRERLPGVAARGTPLRGSYLRAPRPAKTEPRVVPELSFTSEQHGTTPDLRRVSTGLVEVTLQRTQHASASSVLVTAYGKGSGACQLAKWSSDEKYWHLQIACYDKGAASDQPFVVTEASP